MPLCHVSWHKRGNHPRRDSPSNHRRTGQSLTGHGTDLKSPENGPIPNREEVNLISRLRLSHFRMSPGRKAGAAAVLAILVIGSVFGAYYLNTSAALASQGQTISALQSTVSSLVSHPLTSTSTATSVVSATTTRFPDVPWDGGTQFLSTSNGCTGGGAGCFGRDFGQAFVFTCTKAAASPQGCTVQINATNSIAFFVVTVWYPYVNKTAGAPSWANCAFNHPGGTPDQFYAVLPSYCIPIGANAFILTRPPFP
jgi:hypothetical protein